MVKRFFLSAVAFCVTLFITSCGGASMYFHSFGFDLLSDGKVYHKSEYLVLDYVYGESGAFATVMSKQLKNGTYGGGIGGGYMPRPKWLYVKWQNLKTGSISEDRVNLDTRLPKDVTNYTVHFTIFDDQLYVYAFPPVTRYDTVGKSYQTGSGRPVPGKGKWWMDDPYAIKNQIYPDRN